MNITNNTRLAAAAIAASLICGFPFESEGCLNQETFDYWNRKVEAESFREEIDSGHTQVNKNDVESLLSTFQKALECWNFAAAEVLVRTIHSFGDETINERIDKIIIDAERSNGFPWTVPNCILDFASVNMRLHRSFDVGGKYPYYYNSYCVDSMPNILHVLDSACSSIENLRDRAIAKQQLLERVVLTTGIYNSHNLEYMQRLRDELISAYKLEAQLYQSDSEKD